METYNVTIRYVPYAVAGGGEISTQNLLVRTKASSPAMAVAMVVAKFNALGSYKTEAGDPFFNVQMVSVSVYTPPAEDVT